MPNVRFFLLLGSAALFATMASAPVSAKTRLTTPHIGNPSRFSSPSSYDSPMSDTVFGWGNATPRTPAPYAAAPNSPYDPPLGSSYYTGDYYKSTQQQPGPINYRSNDNVITPSWEARIEDKYERFIDWSTELSGGSSVTNAEKGPLPRTAATTLRDRKDATTGYVPMTVRTW